MARGLIHIGGFQILSVPQEVLFDKRASPDNGVVPGRGTFEVNPDTLFYIVSGADIKATQARMTVAVGILY